jgi:hypothetical protein
VIIKPLRTEQPQQAVARENLIDALKALAL